MYTLEKQKIKVNKDVQRMKNLRRLLRLTQVDVSRATEIPRPLYALMEQGKLTPNEAQYKALAELFNVSVQYLQKP